MQKQICLRFLSRDSFQPLGIKKDPLIFSCVVYPITYFHGLKLQRFFRTKEMSVNKKEEICYCALKRVAIFVNVVSKTPGRNSYLTPTKESLFVFVALFHTNDVQHAFAG